MPVGIENDEGSVVFLGQVAIEVETDLSTCFRGDTIRLDVPDWLIEQEGLDWAVLV